jgi:HEAT repeat protein
MPLWKVNILKNSFLISMVTLSLTACSGSGGKGIGLGGGSSTDHGQQSGSAESYRFVQDGCDTKRHNFATNSIDETRKQLCEAIQDDQLNNSCAEPLRRDFFNKKCNGSWIPKYQPLNPPAHTLEPLPSSRTDYAKEEKIRASLNYVLVEDATLASDLTGQEKVAATQLADDLTSCGLSYLGPKCLDYLIYAGSYGGSLDQADGKSIFYSEFKSKNSGLSIAFIFTLDQVDPVVKVSKLMVAKIVKARNGQAISDYLKDASNLSPLLRITLAEDFQQGALKRLQKPRDIRELYHVSSELLRNHENDAQMTKKVSTSFENNAELITKSNLENYQERCVESIFDQLNISKSTMTAMAESLLNSKSKGVRQVVAIYLLNLDPSKADLKSTVVEALNNGRSKIRKLAIEALVKASGLNESEENNILESMNDSADSVREAAIEAGNHLNLGEGNLSTLSQLSQSGYWTIRKAVVSMIRRVPGSKSSALLIGNMADSSDSVRAEIVIQLNSRILGVGDLPALSTQMDCGYWSVRRDAARLIGKIADDVATTVLIDHMSDSGDTVREVIVLELSARTLNASAVRPLEKQLSSGYWTVRKNAVKLIAKISNPAVNTILVEAMSDNADSVRDEIYSQLDKRSLNKELVPVLVEQLQSGYWTVRRDVAKLLGKIKQSSAMDALVSQLKVESNSSVKDEIVKSIDRIK